MRRFLKHKNGKGRIDETSEACVLSHVDHNSIIEWESSVFTSALKNTHVGNSKIIGSVIFDSVVDHALITGGQIENSLIFAELIGDSALIKNSTIARKCRIFHTAYIENCQIENFTVFGDARLIDWEKESFYVDGKGAYISRGEWTRPPKILYLEKDLTVTESVPGFAFVGCQEKPITEWLRVGSRFGKVFGLSADEVQQIREFLLSL